MQKQDYKTLSLLGFAMTNVIITQDAAKPGDHFGKKSILVGESPIVQRAIPLNSKCPCGSGKKYKRCHLAKDLHDANHQR